MTATPITASTRYINKGVTRCIVLPAISDITAVTRSEINAGTDISTETSEFDGWMIESASVETPDLASTFTGSIPGSTTADDSSITTYADVGGTDVRQLLPRGTNCYVVWMDGGDVPGRPMDVFPVRVGSLGKNRSVDDDPATIKINFNITREPAENVIIPA